MLSAFSALCVWATGDMTASAASSRAGPGSTPQLIHVTLHHNVLAVAPSFIPTLDGYFHTQQSVSQSEMVDEYNAQPHR